MSEHSNTPHAAGAATPHGCGRAEELVTYLYGEATPEEARVFRRHLDDCAVCREEFAALGGVRAGLGEWRSEALGSIPSLDIQEALAPVVAPAGRAGRKRSAAAALREFFSLSPFWLRAGAVAALLAVCALTALTLARAEVRWDADGLAFRAGVAERVVVERVKEPLREQSQARYTDEQLNAIVAERLSEERARWEADRQRPDVLNASDAAPKKPAPRAADRPNAPRARRAAPRPAEREDEMADLPRLSDLLNGSY